MIFATTHEGVLCRGVLCKRMLFLFRLENTDAAEVKEFVEKQVELADEILTKCDTREKLKKKVTALYNYPRYGCPTKRGNFCFYNHNTGLQSQAALYMQVTDCQ